MSTASKLFGMIPPKHRATALAYRACNGHIGKTFAMLDCSRETITNYRKESGKVPIGDDEVWLWEAWRLCADAERNEALLANKDDQVAEFRKDELVAYHDMLQLANDDMLLLIGMEAASRDSSDVQNTIKTLLVLLSDRRKSLGLDVSKIDVTGSIETTSPAEALHAELIGNLQEMGISVDEGEA